MQRDGNFLSPVAESWFYQRCLNRPFGKCVLATHKYRFCSHEGIRVEFARLPKKFCQSILFVELQSDPVIFEVELVGEQCECIVYLALVYVRDNGQHHLFRRCSCNANLTHMNDLSMCKSRQIHVVISGMSFTLIAS